MRRLLFILTLALAAPLAFAAQNSPLQLGMVGHTSGSTAEGTGLMLCSAPMIPPTNGTFTHLSVWVENSTGNFQGMIYGGTVAGGPSGALLASTASTSLGSGIGQADATITGGPFAVTAGTVYIPCFQLDNASGVISNPVRGFSGVHRYYETGTTYGSPPNPISVNGSQTAFGWYSIFTDFTPAAGISSCGWPGPLDNLQAAGNVANIVGYQKCIPQATGNLTKLVTWMGSWNGSTPTQNMAVYAADSGVNNGIGSDQFSKTLICQATPITATMAYGWITFTPTGLCPVTAGQALTIAVNVNVNDTGSELCSGAGLSCTPDPTLGPYYYTSTQLAHPYTCCTFATLTPTQYGQIDNNGVDWIANAAYIVASATTGTQIGAFAVGP